jgi:hypothetical protein
LTVSPNFIIGPESLCQRSTSSSEVVQTGGCCSFDMLLLRSLIFWYPNRVCSHKRRSNLCSELLKVAAIWPDKVTADRSLKLHENISICIRRFKDEPLPYQTLRADRDLTAGTSRQEFVTLYSVAAIALRWLVSFTGEMRVRRVPTWASSSCQSSRRRKGRTTRAAGTAIPNHGRSLGAASTIV